MKQHSRKKAAKIIHMLKRNTIKILKLSALSYHTIKTIPISSIGLYYTDPVNLFRLPLILKIQKKIFLSYITRANFMMITSWKKLTDI